jgi:hypothetical protein
MVAGVVKACLTGPGAGPIAAGVAGRLRQAVAAYETYAFDNDDMLKALVAVQPAAVLDALFAGDERDRRAGAGMFVDLDRSNPADEISCEELIAWCDRDREARYLIAAQIVTYARRLDGSGPQVWSEQAKALLANAPDPISVLAVFVERFEPMSWSGSRAALIEANARLLDSLGSEMNAELMAFVAQAKDELARQVARERQRETEEDRARDERFE